MSLSLVNISVSLNNADCHLLLFLRHFSLAHSPSFSPSPHFLSLCPNSFCFLRLSFTLPSSLISSWSSWLQRFPQSPCLFCPHVDQGTLTTSALREFNKFTAMPLWPATMPESLFSTTWPFVFLSHAHSLLPWLSSLQMDIQVPGTCRRRWIPGIWHCRTAHQAILLEQLPPLQEHPGSHNLCSEIQESSRWSVSV